MKCRNNIESPKRIQSQHLIKVRGYDLINLPLHRSQSCLMVTNRAVFSFFPSLFSMPLHSVHSWHHSIRRMQTLLHIHIHIYVRELTLFTAYFHFNTQLYPIVMLHHFNFHHEIENWYCLFYFNTFALFSLFLSLSHSSVECVHCSIFMLIFNAVYIASTQSPLSF